MFSLGLGFVLLCFCLDLLQCITNDTQDAYVTIIVVVCIFLQTEVSSNVESSVAVDIPFIVEVTGGGLRPVVRLEKLDLTR